MYLHVSASPTTLAIEALADGVHGNEHQLLGLLPQLHSHPLERVEGLAGNVNVVLIHLHDCSPLSGSLCLSYTEMPSLQRDLLRNS